MIELHGVQGFLTPGDVAFLFNLASEVPKGGGYLEVGSWMGLSSIIVANGLLANLNLHALIYCVDTWEGSAEHQELAVVKQDALFATFQRNVAEAQMDCFIHPVRGHSPDVARQWQGPKLDVIFIDGDHSAEGCYQDLQSWLPHLATNGRMLGHDAVPGGGVVQALERFRSETGIPFEVHPMPATHYIWELKFPDRPNPVPGLSESAVPG
jgi:predicted O-methyltransferase YrrM